MDEELAELRRLLEEEKAKSDSYAEKIARTVILVREERAKLTLEVEEARRARDRALNDATTLRERVTLLEQLSQRKAAATGDLNIDSQLQVVIVERDSLRFELEALRSQVLHWRQVAADLEDLGRQAVEELSGSLEDEKAARKRVELEKDSLEEALLVISQKHASLDSMMSKLLQVKGSIP